MQLEVITILTGDIMYVLLQNPTKKELSQFISFYRNFKENGTLKYKISCKK